MSNLIFLAEKIAPHTVLILIALSVVVEITPIKISPLTWLGGKIGKFIMKETIDRINKLEIKIDTIQTETASNKVDTIRWNILDFANTCRNGRLHTRAEWEHVLSQIDDYNAFIDENHILNGVLESEEIFLKNRFKERLEKNDFL